jgi:hypothetical protein
LPRIRRKFGKVWWRNERKRRGRREERRESNTNIEIERGEDNEIFWGKTN